MRQNLMAVAVFCVLSALSAVSAGAQTSATWSYNADVTLQAREVGQFSVQQISSTTKLARAPLTLTNGAVVNLEIQYVSPGTYSSPYLTLFFGPPSISGEGAAVLMHLIQKLNPNRNSQGIAMNPAYAEFKLVVTRARQIFSSWTFRVHSESEVSLEYKYPMQRGSGSSEGGLEKVVLYDKATRTVGTLTFDSWGYVRLWRQDGKHLDVYMLRASVVINPGSFNAISTARVNAITDACVDGRNATIDFARVESVPGASTATSTARILHNSSY